MLDAYCDQYEQKVTEAFPANKYVNLAESYYRDGYEFLKNFDGINDLEILDVEAKFSETIEDFLYTGIIDLIYKDTGGIVIRDWKSKSKFANKAEQKKYSRQPFSYSLHVNNKYGIPPKELQFFMFRRQNIVSIPFAQEGYEESIEWIKNSVAEIRTHTEFPATPDEFFCNALCGHRNTCKKKCGDNQSSSTAKKSTKPKKNSEKMQQG